MAESAERDARVVFVVHGRNEGLRRAMFEFLRSIDLTPMEWTRAVELTGSASPYIGQVLDAAFANAQAVVVLMTPDEVAYLQPVYGSGDDDAETLPAPQARPNVLFEAGMAMGHDPDRTVLVEVGHVRPFSDVAGRHAIRLTNDVAKRQDLAQRLRTAGCAVDLSGTDWHTQGDFTAPDRPGGGLPLGRRLVAGNSRSGVRLDADYYPRSKGAGDLKIVNRGTETAYNVEIELPEGGGLHIHNPEPIPKIPGHGKSVTVPVMKLGGNRLGSSGGASAFDLVLTARTDGGDDVREEVFIDTRG